MKKRDIYIVAGLGYGDEGKGSITEFLASECNAKVTVRYNGGPQAAHHVVKENGEFHCFSQFASSSFLPNVRSHLAHSMLVKPSNLFAELDVLNQKGCFEINSRFSLDPECYIVTPWHAMLGKMEELARGAERLGSVGMGVGKAAYDRKTENPNALKIKDFYKPTLLALKLAALWEEANDRAEQIIKENPENRELLQIYKICRDGCTPEVMLQEYLNSGRLLDGKLISDSQLVEYTDGNIILEGAQGALLDCKHGFLPHVTKTDTTFDSALPFLKSAGLENHKIHKVGILRSYATRHGAGPFVTEDMNLREYYPEMHNMSHPWQGSFRIGHFDLLATRYAIQVSGKPDFLALTQLDLVGKQTDFSVCNSYEYIGSAQKAELEQFFNIKTQKGKLIISAIKYQKEATPEQQLKLTKLLHDCIPHSFVNFAGWSQNYLFKHRLPYNLQEFIDYLESESGLDCPIKILSYGASLREKLSLIY